MRPPVPGLDLVIPLGLTLVAGPAKGVPKSLLQSSSNVVVKTLLGSPGRLDGSILVLLSESEGNSGLSELITALAGLAISLNSANPSSEERAGEREEVEPNKLGKPDNHPLEVPVPSLPALPSLQALPSRLVPKAVGLAPSTLLYTGGALIKA